MVKAGIWELLSEIHLITTTNILKFPLPLLWLHCSIWYLTNVPFPFHSLERRLVDDMYIKKKNLECPSLHTEIVKTTTFPFNMIYTITINIHFDLGRRRARGVGPPMASAGLLHQDIIVFRS